MSNVDTTHTFEMDFWFDMNDTVSKSQPLSRDYRFTSLREDNCSIPAIYHSQCCKEQNISNLNSPVNVDHNHNIFDDRNWANIQAIDLDVDPQISSPSKTKKRKIPLWQTSSNHLIRQTTVTNKVDKKMKSKTPINIEHLLTRLGSTTDTLFIFQWFSLGETKAILQYFDPSANVLGVGKAAICQKIAEYQNLKQSPISEKISTVISPLSKTESFERTIPSQWIECDLATKISSNYLHSDQYWRICSQDMHIALNGFDLNQVVCQALQRLLLKTKRKRSENRSRSNLHASNSVINSNEDSSDLVNQFTQRLLLQLNRRSCNEACATSNTSAETQIDELIYAHDSSVSAFSDVEFTKSTISEIEFDIAEADYNIDIKSLLEENDTNQYSNEFDLKIDTKLLEATRPSTPNTDGSNETILNSINRGDTFELSPVFT